MKPTKYGVKLFEVCEVGGYCSFFKLYSGRSQHPAGTRTFALAFELLENAGLLDKGHHLFTDRYYTSPQLAMSLHQRQTYLCGTVNRNKAGMPADFHAGGLRQGEMLVRHDSEGCMNVIQWRDKRDVFLISTTEQPRMVHTAARRPGAQPHNRPNIVHTYNSGKDGVDQNDQLCGYYSMERKSMKWYKKVFWRLIGIATVNALIVYKEVTGSTISHLDFVKQLIRDLLLEGQPMHAHRQPRLPQQQHQQSLRLLPGNHYPQPHPPTPSKHNPCKTCIVCSHVKRRVSLSV